MADARPGQGVVWTSEATTTIGPLGEPYRPLGRLSGWLAGLLAAVIVVDVADLGMSVTALMLLGRATSAPGTLDGGSVARLDAIETGFAVLMVAVQLTTAVVFIVWFRRAYRNLVALGTGIGLRYAAGWAVGAWFVPFLNLGRPKRIADDIWRGSDPSLETRDTSWFSVRPPTLIMAWWLAWLLTSLVGNVLLQGFLYADGVPELTFAYRMAVVSGIVDIVAAVLAIMVVFGVNARQGARAVALARAGALPPALRHPAHV